MNTKTIQRAMQVIGENTLASSDELGAIHACLLDVPEASQKILNEILPSLIDADGDKEGILEQFVDLRLEIEHIQGHLVHAEKALESVSNRLRQELDVNSDSGEDRLGHPQ